MSSILASLLLLVLLAASLFVGLYLFVSLKRENLRLRRRMDDERLGLQTALEGMQSTIERMERAQLRAAERKPVPVPVPAPAPPPVAPLASAAQSDVIPVATASINLTKRSQALKLQRLGESPGQIAAKLQLPRNEVELLLKVHRSVMSQL